MAMYFKCTTNKPALSYRCGEPIVFTVTARDHCVEQKQEYIRWTVSGDDGETKSGAGSCAPGYPLVIKTSLKRPGFVRLSCNAFDACNRPLPDFDPLEAGAGAEVEKIAYCDEIPADFDDFWGNAERLVRDFPLTVLKKESVAQDVHPDFDCWAIELASPFGNPVTGLLAVPKADGVFPVDVTFHGYSLATSVVQNNLSFEPGRIQLDVNAHGLPVQIPTFWMYEKYAHLNNYGFDETENKRPETTYWYGMIIRDLMAMKFAKTLDKWDKKNLTARGGSQGAFQATNVAAHDPDVSFLNISIPWFSNLKGEICGYMSGWRPKFAEGLRYFDTAAQATRVRCPVQITGYLGDYVCPPSSLMALYHNFHTIKALTFIQAGTHGYRPPEIERFELRDAPDYPNGAVRPGRYRHYKGGEYRVLYTARNSETGAPEVVYQALYGENDIWVRPAGMWSETVETPEGRVMRFQYIGE